MLECEREIGKQLEDDVKIGVVIMAMDAARLREHVLLPSEKCGRYDEFREELETLARAKSAGQMNSAPMDLSVHEGEPHHRGKTGHKEADCWRKKKQQQPQHQEYHRKGQDKGKGGRQRKDKGKYTSKSGAEKCFKCGRVGHRSKDCQLQKVAERKQRMVQRV